MSADHPLAQAAAHCHPWTDAVLAAQAQGEALDARVAALASLTEPTLAAREEIVAVARALGEAAGQQESGATPRYWTWYRSQVGVIIAHAVRLGFDPEALDIRKPSWRP